MLKQAQVQVKVPNTCVCEMQSIATNPIHVCMKHDQWNQYCCSHTVADGNASLMEPYSALPMIPSLDSKNEG